MLQTIINSVVPVAVTALVGVLVAVIKAIGNVGVEFINQKIKALQVSTGADTYNKNLAFAKAAYAIVDENFRITPELTKTVAAAQAAFAVEIKKFIPAITDEQIEQLRQAVAGEINQGKADIVAPAEK
jgi:hypothetical protein